MVQNFVFYLCPKKGGSSRLEDVFWTVAGKDKKYSNLMKCGKWQVNSYGRTKWFIEAADKIS